MINPRKEIGTKAELRAKAFLEQQGLNYVTSNFFCRQGEIDLVMLEQNIIVFVEVKYRKNNLFASEKESVGLKKQQRLLHTSLFYLQKHPEYADYQARFDVILITNLHNEFKIEWISDAFQA